MVGTALVLSVLALALSIATFQHILRENRELTAAVVEALAGQEDIIQDITPETDRFHTLNEAIPDYLEPAQDLIAGETVDSLEYAREQELIEQGKAVAFDG